jgi:transglutaminase-like putative cysteine protease
VSEQNVSGRIYSARKREVRPPAYRAFTNSNTAEFDIFYDISAPGQTHRISFTALIPKTIPRRQNIIEIQYSPKPSRIFEQNGNRYAEFIFDKPEKQNKINIRIKVELFKYDLVTAKRKHKPDHISETELDDFLKSEKYIEKDDHEIRQIAQGIDGQTEEEIVKKIYSLVIEHLDYSKHDKGQLGAAKALQAGKGDCSEYSDLFAALCRAKNIPARVITGCTIRFDSDSPKHNWVEVYLKDYGWVPFEPSTEDATNTRVQNAIFGRMAPVYVYFSNIRNDEVLRNYHFTLYRYWGDKVRLKESIEFRRPPKINSK